MNELLKQRVLYVLHAGGLVPSNNEPRTRQLLTLVLFVVVLNLGLDLVRLFF